MIKPRTMTLLTLSVILSIGAAWIANNWIRGKSNANSETQNVNIVVAATDIPYGHKIESVNLKTITVPKDLAPDDAVTDSENLIGMVSREAIIEDDILRSRRFSKHLEGSTLAAVISPDKRAVTVRVNDVVGVAGFLLPGNEVDVLASRKNNKKVVTDTILKKIKVLAVDQTKSTNKNDPVIVRAVTLEATPTQAEAIVKAREEGSLQLTLRNPLEEERPEPQKKSAPVKRYPYHTAYVTVIRGTNAELKKVTYKK